MKIFHWVGLLFLMCVHATRMVNASDQARLDAGGPEAELVIQEAYQQLASTWIFEFPEKQILTNSASCWALSVLVGYDQERAKDRLSEAFESSGNIYVRIYALVGLHLMDQKNSKWKPLNQAEEFLNTRVSFYDPLGGGGGIRSTTIRDLFRRIENQGGYPSLLLKTPLSDRKFIAHPERPIFKM